MRFAKLATAAALTVGSVAMTTTHAHAQPIITGGLVDVVVNDVTILEDVNLAVALGVAANVCDTSVNLLARQFRAGDTTCSNDDNTLTAEIVR
jgi:hypothetical protein